MKHKKKVKHLDLLDLLIGVVDRAVRYVEQTNSQTNTMARLTGSRKKLLAHKTFDVLAEKLDIKHPGDETVGILIEAAVHWMNGEVECR